MEELSAGTTLFWRAVPVLLRRGERGEERPLELTIRLIAAGQKRGQGVRLSLAASLDDVPTPAAAAAMSLSRADVTTLLHRPCYTPAGAAVFHLQ